MKHELKRVDPRRTANMLAAIYGVMFLAFSILAVPMMLLTPDVDPAGNALPKALMVVVVLLYPAIGAIFGWIGGYFACAVYNAVAKRLGGLLFETEAA